jgi:hypothetical protein
VYKLAWLFPVSPTHSSLPSLKNSQVCVPTTVHK